MHSVAARRTSSWSLNWRYSSVRTPPFSLVMRFLVASSTLAKLVSPSSASKCIRSSALWSCSSLISGGIASSRCASVSTFGLVVTRILPKHHAASRTHLTDAVGELARSEQTRNAPCCTMLPRTGTSTAICRSAIATCSWVDSLAPSASLTSARMPSFCTIFCVRNATRSGVSSSSSSSFFCLVIRWSSSSCSGVMSISFSASCRRCTSLFVTYDIAVAVPSFVGEGGTCNA
mmetsp:Transcript_7134/g.13017  ORF Transcript_7134/g.13017 Transcript_7134/m.13017 type:complete len:232 (+) Transcript_7134:822-1517(+)